MVTATQETVGQWLERLAVSDTSEEIDSKKMANLLHRVGFTDAVVVCGIVYMEGHGTMEAPPMSIHSIASMLVKQAHTGGKRKRG